MTTPDTSTAAAEPTKEPRRAGQTPPPIKLYIFAVAPGVAQLTANWDELGEAAQTNLTRAASAEDITLGVQYEGRVLYRAAGGYARMDADAFVEASAENMMARLRESGFVVELERGGHI